MDNIKLKIDSEFKHLIRPLKRKEYIQLESNIIADGCRDPIITWNGLIVDGHNRYEICTRHNIPFTVKEMEFDCREAVIAWICANQLGRRNISEETRKFLIGMQYESEKVVSSKRNARGINQYTSEDDTDYIVQQTYSPTGHVTAQRIADENHISHGTVQKYAIYTRALEEIGKKEPKLVPKILSGQYKISHKNVVELSKLPAEDVQRVNRKIDKNPEPFIQYKSTRNAINTGRYEAISETPTNVPSVKDMPEYDPDSEITGLTLTIPSWCSSIDRTMKNTDFNAVSISARKKLTSALFALQEKTDEMLDQLKEGE